jgi:hypothetical protein
MAENREGESWAGTCWGTFVLLTSITTYPQLQVGTSTCLVITVLFNIDQEFAFNGEANVLFSNNNSEVRCCRHIFIEH